MKYAVISLQGHQYKVEEGQEILVDSLGGEKPDPKVFLVVDGKAVKIGTPEVSGAKVSLKVLGEEKGKKLYVQTFKAKSRYRRKKGFRPLYTHLLVQSIS